MAKIVSLWPVLLLVAAGLGWLLAEQVPAGCGTRAAPRSASLAASGQRTAVNVNTPRRVTQPPSLTPVASPGTWVASLKNEPVALATRTRSACPT